MCPCAFESVLKGAVKRPAEGAAKLASCCERVSMGTVDTAVAAPRAATEKTPIGSLLRDRARVERRADRLTDDRGDFNIVLSLTLPEGDFYGSGRGQLPMHRAALFEQEWAVGALERNRGSPRRIRPVRRG